MSGNGLLELFARSLKDERLMREHMSAYVTAVTEREPYLMDEVVDWC